MRFESNLDEPQVLSDAAVANRRLIGGILVSLLFHALILSLQFGIPGLDLPSLEVPWKERRTPIESLRVEIASPAPKALPLPPTPAVTSPELFKLPTPILPPPVPKDSLPVSSAIQILAAKPSSAPLPEKVDSKKTTKLKAPKLTPQVVKVVPPPAQAPTRIIAQELTKNDDFVVPLTSEEDVLRNVQDKKEANQKLEAIPADAVIDKNAEAELKLEQQRQEELKQQKIEQDKILAEQKQQVEDSQKQIVNASLAKLKQQEDQLAVELKRQQVEQIAQHKLRLQREREQALEEALQEAKRQELLTQETLKQEEQRRQAEQKRVRQLAQEQEQQKQEALAQAQLRQKQLEEESEKKRALELAERRRQDELELQRIEQQRQAQLAQQKELEQKAAEQRALEQKLVQQKLLEQKIAEQAMADQRAAEQKAIADAARANAAKEAAAQAQTAKLAGAQTGNQTSMQAGSGNAKDAVGQGKTSTANANSGLPQSLGSGDLASRLREQARNSDLFKSAPSTGKLSDDKPARRRSFLGAYDKEVPLRMYVDSLKQKVERNGNLIYERRTLSDVEHNVLVNMVVRSDGSIEDVTIMRSSGSRAIDEKARNIIMANAPYSAFPPALALKYDVIEIQRVWSFGDRLRILDNLPSSF